MRWLGALLILFVVIELWLRIPVIPRLKTLADTVLKSQRVITSKRISDHWKEKILLAYAQTLFLQTLWIFALFIVVFSPLAVGGFVMSSVGIDVFSLFLTGPGIVISIAVVFSYVWARKHILHRS